MEVASRDAFVGLGGAVSYGAELMELSHSSIWRIRRARRAFIGVLVKFPG